jgi:hypothetical protein
MAKNVIAIHPSTLISLDCRQQYYWSRTYKTKSPAPAFTFGLAIHEALEQYYGEGRDLVEAFKETSKDLDFGFRTLGELMVRNYLKEYQGKENFETIATEIELARKIPVPQDETPGQEMTFYVAARLDAIVKDKNLDQVLVLEHKTFDRFYPESLAMDMQFVFEKFVAEGFFKNTPVKVRGVIYNGLRKKGVGTKATRLFERHTIYINGYQVRVALYRAYWTLKQIHSGHFPIFPQPSSLKCAMCQFKTPCGEYMRGGDYQFLLDHTFIKRDEKEQQEWI